jgi:hypothetical protein
MDCNCLPIAVDYTRRGWSVIPIPFRSKNPDRSGWERLRLQEADLSSYFGHRPRNIGVLLGAPSNWLVDVDLDHERAVMSGRQCLPKTGAVFGRPSKRRSHYLYIVSQPISTRQLRLPDRRMVVELRSTGGQTLFPGSTHPSGERISWDSEGEPATVEPSTLVAALTTITSEVRRELGLPEDLEKPVREDAAPAPPSVIQRARQYLSKLPVAVSGSGGHDATFRAACVLVLGFGLDRKQSLAVLGEWNSDCQPPWTEKELEHKVDDALKQPGWRGYLLSGDRRNTSSRASRAIARANRHAIEHRRRALRRARA